MLSVSSSCQTSLFTLVWFLLRLVSTFLQSASFSFLNSLRFHIAKYSTIRWTKLILIAFIPMCMRNWKLDIAVDSYAKCTEHQFIRCDCSNKLSHHLVVLYNSINNTEADANEADRQRELGTGSREWDTMERRNRWRLIRIKGDEWRPGNHSWPWPFWFLSTWV